MTGGDADGLRAALLRDPTVSDRRRGALLWGVVGALSFLVLHQAYLLVGGRFLGVVPVAAVAVAAGAGSALGSYALAGALPTENEQG